MARETVEERLDVNLAVAVAEYMENLDQMLKTARRHLGNRNPVLADREIELAQKDLDKVIQALKSCADPVSADCE